MINMSHTSIINSAGSRTSTSTSMGSPRKRRLQHMYNKSVANTGHSSTKIPISTEIATKPSEEAVYKWTLTKDAVASCFNKDILEMKANENKELDFYWLGRIPCRVVNIVGLVVGVDVYEKKTMYTLDDGTGVMECLFQHPPSTKPSAVPKSAPQSSTRSDPLTKYRSTYKTQLSSSTSRHITREVASPVPIAQVGEPARVEGRVVPYRDYRRLYVNKLERCRSSNAEVAHWSSVLQLHQTDYFPKKSVPFTILKPTLVPISTFIPPPTGPPTVTPQTPTSRSRVTRVDPMYTSSTLYSSAPSSPIRSPTRSVVAEVSLVKISHPSRVRPDNLTDLTFRIHLKHYMEHSSSFMSNDGHTQHDPEQLLLMTPTRPRRNGYPSTSLGLDQTPRPTRSQTGAGDGASEKCCGFTLSHLRRVPELAMLAKRVVKAEASRRAAQPSSTSSTPRISRKHSAQKVKQLFSSTLIKLHQEGLVVLWDGPAWPLTPEAAHSAEVSTGLWKDPSSKSSQSRVDKSSASNVSAGLHKLDISSVSTRKDDNSELSDPGQDETSYIPVSATILCADVENIIKTLVEDERRQARTARSGAVAVRGATKATITARLRHSDEKWMHMGEWIVEDTLVALKDQGRIWEVGNGRWEVCL